MDIGRGEETTGKNAREPTEVMYSDELGSDRDVRQCGYFFFNDTATTEIYTE